MWARGENEKTNFPRVDYCNGRLWNKTFGTEGLRGPEQD
jgi:hypothetical protein